MEEPDVAQKENGARTSPEAEAGTAPTVAGVVVPGTTRTNLFYYGDNLDIFWGEHVAPASVDLIYLDPPFNSKKKYSVIFKDESGRRFDAQPMAFDDTWHWGPTAREHLRYLGTTTMQRRPVPPKVTATINAIKDALGENPMTAYLVEMTIRLVLARLLWLATSEAQPWMPTPGEADAVAERVKGEFVPRDPQISLGVHPVGISGDRNRRRADWEIHPIKPGS